MSEEQNPFRERLRLLTPISNLQSKQQEQLLLSAEVLSFRKKDYVFQQGDRDSYSFYLLSGELEMWSGDQLIKKIVGGEAASFQPLAQLQPRQMSAKALGNSQVLRVDRRFLDKLLSLGNDEPAAASIEVEEYEAQGTIDWLASMLQSELFARIPPSNIQRLIDTLETIEAKAGEIIIQQGATGDYYYILQRGTAEVCRATRLGKEIKLAELGPGNTFGEEALVSNAKRNATVRMLTDGALGRLTQEHFIALIQEPVLRGVSLTVAKELVGAGARWLDVRFPEEHRVNGLANSLNLPLSFLRARLKELDANGRYVAYCDTGGRSSAAAFLLTQEGYEVCYVQNGAIDE
ncbi:MAG: cyclic nucleotide-binding domain-containing protein, partial [Candidatus Binatia bacterium]